jgi:hypothetical protein
VAKERGPSEGIVEALMSRRRLAPTEFESRFPAGRLAFPRFPGIAVGEPPPGPAAPTPAEPPQPSPALPPLPPEPIPAPPEAPPASPFAELPYPSPGDRIKAEDFRKLSQALQIVSDAYALAGATFGYPFGQVKLALAAQQYEIARIVSASGTELANTADAALDDRKVLHVSPVVLGERRVTVVVAEGADVRRYMPDLRGLTYRQAAARIQAELGDLTAGGPPMVTPPLQGLTLTEAARRISG